jgi:hypothetical protein
MYQSEIDSEICALEQLLAQSDYLALKHADGALTDEEYAGARAERQQWRDRINELQAMPAEADPEPETAEEPAQAPQEVDDASVDELGD